MQLFYPWGEINHLLFLVLEKMGNVVKKYLPNLSAWENARSIGIPVISSIIDIRASYVPGTRSAGKSKIEFI